MDDEVVLAKLAVGETEYLKVTSCGEDCKKIIVYRKGGKNFSWMGNYKAGIIHICNGYLTIYGRSIRSGESPNLSQVTFSFDYGREDYIYGYLNKKMADSQISVEDWFS